MEDPLIMPSDELVRQAIDILARALNPPSGIQSTTGVFAERRKARIEAAITIVDAYSRLRPLQTKVVPMAGEALLDKPWLRKGIVDE